MYDKTVQQIEDENRQRVLHTLASIPRRTPKGWKRSDIVVGGLEYIGFSELQPGKLICISSQHCSVIDCETRAIAYHDIAYDELELTAVTDVLPGEIMLLSGIGGGGLRRFSPQGDALMAAAPEYPKVQIIFQPERKSCFLDPKACSIIFEDYEIRAYVFSRCGNYIVAACSGGVSIFARQQD